MKNTHAAFRFSFCAAALLVWSMSSALSADEEPRRPIKVAGKILIAKRQGRDIKAATLTAADGTVYQLIIDEKGASLAAVMNRERAEIVGTVVEQGGEKRLAVHDYSDVRVTAGHELWRRMRCNACVVAPALINATVPKDLRSAEPISGRYYSFKSQFKVWTRDARYLWLGSDNQILQVDLERKRVVQSYGKENGLPDEMVYQLLSDGKTLWIVYRGGVAALPIGEERVVDLPALKSVFARVFADDKTTWVIADTGTFRLKTPRDSLTTAPPLPSAKRIRQIIEKGIWLPHWHRKTAHLIADPTSVGSKLYVSSYGSIYELDHGQWNRVCQRGWELTAKAGRVWFVTSKGLTEYDPKAEQQTTHVPPGLSGGRYADLLASQEAIWVAVEPIPDAKRRGSDAGGLARFDLKSRTWQTWKEINGETIRQIDSLEQSSRAVWAVTRGGKLKEKPAHPGMTYVKRTTFETLRFGLHRFDAEQGNWESFPLALRPFESRLICGQDGSRGADEIVPQSIDDIAVGLKRIFAATRLFPRTFFSGYWPSVNQIASREDATAPWSAAFQHSPDQLNLQGEQPLVLNISNKGEMILEAVGHDRVLGLFLHGSTHWVVTEGCAASFDEASTSWRKILETSFRFYWRATAALDDGRSVILGSDRGLVGRLNLKTGRFESLIALKGRSISRIVKGKAGDILVGSRLAPLGMLPVYLQGKIRTLDSDVVAFDGKTWRQAALQDLPPTADESQWFFRQIKKRNRMDKSLGNFLWRRKPGERGPKPRFYVKDVFFPQFLCASPDGSRLWLGTFTGLVRLDAGKATSGG